MKLGDIVATAISGLTVLAVAGGVMWLLSDWREQKEQVYVLRSAVLSQNNTLTMKDETIKAYSEALSSWKDRYEQLRWQLRTAPPTGRR